MKLFDPAKAKNDPVKIAFLHHLQLKPDSNYGELVEKIGYSIATIKRHIQVLKRLELIERIGGDKTGF